MPGLPLDKKGIAYPIYYFADRFIKTLKENIKAFRTDTRKAILFTYSQDLWNECGELINGMSFHLKNLPIYEKASKILDSLSPCTPHSKAIQTLKYKLFNKKPENPYQIAACSMLYKMWWYDQSRKGGHLVSLIERQVDWVMHNILLEQKNWDLSCVDAVQMVKKYFHKNLPLLPFKPHWAESSYSMLKFLLLI